jgi:hypothetical protein
MDTSSISQFKFYTYAHYRLSDGEIFYIGKGTSSRCSEISGRNTYWRNVVNKHGFYHAIIAYFNDELAAYKHEEQLISEYKDAGACLTNLSSGGSGGAKGLRKSEEWRNKIGAAHKNRKKSPELIEKMRINAIKQFSDQKNREIARINQTGKKQSEECCRKKSEWARLNPLTEEHKSKIIAKNKSRTGCKHSPETIEKIRTLAIERARLKHGN